MRPLPIKDSPPDGAVPPAPCPSMGPSVVSSAELLAGGRELVIRHGPERYRLLLTGQNKLILTK